MSNRSKKLLIVSYFFPPVGGGGVIRVTKFAKYLPKFNWKPYILTVKNGFYPIQDLSLIEDISKEAIVKRISYFEPGFWFKWRPWQSFLRFFLYPLILIPDNQLLWLFPAVWHGYKIIKKEKIQIIFTSACSFTDHLIALMLKKLCKVKWVADFRDEWTINPDYHFPTKFHRRISQVMEKTILRNADLVVSVNETLTRQYIQLEGQDQKKFLTLTNGFDPDDFLHVKNAKKEKYMTIIHTGALYNNRHPGEILKAVEELKLPIKIQFLGQKKRFNHKEASKELSKSDVLLLVLGAKERPSTMTGKIFEYLAMRKPILALSPRHTEVAKLIINLKVGDVVQPDNLDEIKETLRKMFSRWQKNTLNIPKVNIEQYNRQIITKRLAEKLNSLINNRPFRICLIGNLNSPQNQNLCQYLHSNGYEVHFITTQEAKLKGVRTYFLGKIFYTPLYLLISLRKIRKLLQTIQPDIVHGQDLVFGGIWAYLSGFRPFVVTAWGSDVMNYDQFIKLEKILIKRTLQKADLVTCSSKALQKQAEIIGLKKNKSQLVHFGINMKVFRRIKSIPKSKIVFCPRAIGPIYNTDILIHAFVAVARKDKGIKLALLNNVGDRSYAIEIQKLIISNSLQSRVVYWPKVTNRKMVNYYNKAEVIISIPSSDGCSVSFLEAMACENKIVVTNLPYIEEWKQSKNLWQVPIRDIQATSAAILKAFKTNNVKWQKKGELNRRLVAQKAEINNNFDKLDKLYRGLL